MNQIDPYTANSIECRDWLAEHDQWHRIEPANQWRTQDEWWRYTVSAEHGGRTWCIHPFRDTLDDAFKALPKAMFNLCIRQDYCDGKLVGWVAGANTDTRRFDLPGPDPLTAVYRLVVAYWAWQSEA